MPTPYAPGAGSIDAVLGADGAEEGVRHLEQDARAVAGVGLAAARAAMAQVHQHGQRLAQDPIRAPAVDIGHKTDAASCTLSARVIKGII